MLHPGRGGILVTRRQGVRGLLGRTNGGMIVHLGVIIIAVAFAASGQAMRCEIGKCGASVSPRPGGTGSPLLTTSGRPHPSS